MLESILPSAWFGVSFVVSVVVVVVVWENVPVALEASQITSERKHRQSCRRAWCLPAMRMRVSWRYRHGTRTIVGRKMVVSFVVYLRLQATSLFQMDQIIHWE